MEIQKIAKSVIQSKTRTQELQRNTSMKPNKKDKKILVRARSEGTAMGPLKALDRSHTPGPPASELQLPPQRPRSAWNFSEEDEDMLCGRDAFGRPSSAANLPSQLFYTTPPKTNMIRQQEVSRRVDSGSNTLTRLGKKLGYKEKVKVEIPKDRQRSVSLDCGDGRKIKIFMSETADPTRRIPHSASSSGLKSLEQAALNGSPTPLSGKKKSFSQSEIDLTPLSSKMFDKRRSDKEKRNLFDNQALFDAVEQQDLDRVKKILESSNHSVHINSLNSEGMTPLDIAIMTNNIPMAKLLLQHNARESPVFQRVANRSERLDSLVGDAERRVVELSAAILNSPYNSSSGSSQKDNERKLSHWEFRHKLLKRMKAGYDHARVPDPPSYVSLTVSSGSSLLVKFDEPLNHNGAVVTKYKVEWSCVEDFAPLAGEDIVDNMQQLEYEITGLGRGIKYYVRVSACNMKGYSQSMSAKPLYAVPSNWRDIEGTPTSRFDGKHNMLEKLFEEVKQLRPPDAGELKSPESPQLRKKKGIKNLFTSSPKFYKTLKRGVYVMALVYHGDKLLVTADDQPPIVEVDESLSGSSEKDLQWLMKIACNWDDVRCYKHDMEKCTSAGVWHTRHKYLQALANLQNALGLVDLGQFYHKPLKDPSGNFVVLTTVCVIPDTKQVTLSSGKWMNVSRIQQFSNHGFVTDTVDICDGVFGNIPDIFAHHKSNSEPLPKGLYVAYLKMQVAVEAIQIVTCRKCPNMLPCQQVRNYPNVSREEWEWLTSLKSNQSESPKSPVQAEFQTQVMSALHKLFESLGIPESHAKEHRLYDLEPLEVSENVSILLVMPPTDSVCVVPGQADDITARPDLMLLPMKLFEMSNMFAYRRSLLAMYCRLSTVLEIDLNLAQQYAREAFSTEELQQARSRVQSLAGHQTVVEDTWRSLRWAMDIITYARDRSNPRGLPLAKVMEGHKAPEPEELHDNNNTYPVSPFTFDDGHISVGKDNRKIAKYYDPTQEKNVSNTNGLHLVAPGNAEDMPLKQVSQMGVIQVYPAYDTGLSKTSRVRLHINSKTTAREVVNLVVRQLNKAAIMRGSTGPVYGEDQLSDFCLVSVIGARERILRDDYPPLSLQNPWASGKLYVRLRHNLLAAIQHGHATVV